MTAGKRALVAGAAVLAVMIVAAGATRVVSPRATNAPLLIFTQIPADDAGWNAGDGEGQWFPDRSRIVALDAGADDGDVRVLTADFHSARAPMVSPDGKRMVFSGRRLADDPWQIWEMRLNDGRTRLLTPGSGWYTDPAYLSDERVVVSGRAGTTAGAFALYATDGVDSGLLRITFHPDADLSAQVLPDGQVVFVTGGTRYLVTREDGSGLRLFYESPTPSRPSGRVWESAGGRILFVERAPNGQGTGGRLVGFSQSRPLHSRVELSDRLTGSFHSLYPLASGKLLVSYRPPDGRNFSLYEFDPVAQRLEPLTGSDPTYHAVEPVLAEARARPKSFYSVVDPTFKTGELYCLDANRSSLPPAGARTSVGRRLRVLGLEGLLGEVPLAADGSFNVVLPADVPVRLETVDGQGRLVRGPSAWLWLRPNEQRGCVGCHERPELAPDNRVPMALITEPDSVPLAPSKASGGARQ